MPESNDKTSLTLLGRLQQDAGSEAAWEDFATRYGPMIERWCRSWGLQPSDAQDVSQNVLLELSRQLRRGDYRPTGRFRSWLKTIAYRAWCDYLKRYARPGRGSGDGAVLQMLESMEARDSFLQRIAEECDRELLEIAMESVQARVQANTWEAFRLMTFEGLSGAEVAQKMDMKVGSVFVAKSRIDRMLAEEVQRIDEDSCWH